MSKILDEPSKYNTAYSRLKRFFQSGNTESIFKFVCVLIINTFARNSECYLLLECYNLLNG